VNAIASRGNRQLLTVLLRPSLHAKASVRGVVRGRLGSDRDDHGATAAEYALMASLIAVVIVGAVTLFGRNVSQLFTVPSSVFSP
jgi:Flp pilus assembly pilin Flp